MREHALPVAQDLWEPVLGAWRYVWSDWPSTHACEMVSMVWSRDRPRRERVAEGRVVSIRGEGAHGNVQGLGHNGGRGNLDECSRPTRLDE